MNIHFLSSLTYFIKDKKTMNLFTIFFIIFILNNTHCSISKDNQESIYKKLYYKKSQRVVQKNDLDHNRMYNGGDITKIIQKIPMSVSKNENDTWFSFIFLGIVLVLYLLSVIGVLYLGKIILKRPMKRNKKD